jgi:HEAT repeat protein
MHTPKLTQALLTAMALTVPVAWTDETSAQGHDRAAAARKTPKVDTKAIEVQLKTRNPAEIRAALSAAKQAGQGAAPLALAIERLLADGLPSDLGVEAMQALGAIGLESSSKPLATMTHHRDPKIRREAARAMIKTRGAEAVKALRRCMSDADGSVREVGASGLGALGAREMVADLFIALDHKVVEAGGAIGQLCTPEQCEQLVARIGRVSFDILSPGFDQILFRQAVEISEDLKIKVVGRVREMGTVEANRLLKDMQGRWPAKGSKKIKQAIDQGVIATEGAAGTRPEGATP